MEIKPSEESRKPICVVVDTNIWRRVPLLKTPMGTTLVYNLSRRNGFIGLPEVVELELKKQLIQAGNEALDEVQKNSRLLNALTDDCFFCPEITEEKFNQAVDKQLAELSPLLVREPFTIEQAKAALAMVNAEVPPNGHQNQQFKDSVIWQAVLAFSHKYSVFLLSDDKGFFCDRDYKKGLAKNLLEDCTKADCTVKVFNEISSFLQYLGRDEPDFDREHVKELVIAEAKPQLEQKADRFGYVLTKLLKAEILAFPTEDTNRLAIDYTLTYETNSVFPELQEQYGNSQGIIHGSCYLFPEEDKIVDNYFQRIVIKSSRFRYAEELADPNMFPRPLPRD